MAEEFDKLVRDRIPEVIADDDDHPITHVATGAEYRRRISGWSAYATAESKSTKSGTD